VGYNSVAVRLAVVAFKIYEIARNSKKILLIAVQGHRPWCQSKANVRLPICH